MKTAIVFTGQGSQHCGMGREFFEESAAFADIVEMSSEYAGMDLKKMMLEADEKTLSDTAVAQPALAAYAAGVAELLKEKGMKPDFTAGLSLGEYSALYLAGVFDLETFIRLTAFRGKVMKKCAESVDGKMYAVLGADPEAVEQICLEVSTGGTGTVSISNYNCKGQNVIAGVSKAVDAAAGIIKERGLGKCVPLKVSSAFHTELMAPASRELKDYLEDVRFSEMEIPVVFNVTGKPEEAPVTEAAMKELLVKQVKSPVRMSQTIDFLSEAGVSKIIEVGPGKTIAGFIKRSAPEMKVVSVNDPATLSF